MTTDMSVAVRAALGVIDKAQGGLKALMPQSGTPTQGVNPLDLLPDNLETWRVVMRPLVASKLGNAALKAFDNASRPMASRPRPYGSRIRPEAIAFQQATLRVREYQRVFAAMRTAVESYGDEYLAAGGVALSSAAEAEDPPEQRPDAEQSPLEILDFMVRRFHLVAQQLRNRHNKRDTLMVEDEYDVRPAWTSCSRPSRSSSR